MAEKSANESDVLLKEFEKAKLELREAAKKYLFVRGTEVKRSAIENALGNEQFYKKGEREMNLEQKYIDKLKSLEEKICFLLFDGSPRWILQMQEYIPESEEKIREALEKLSETGLVRIVKEKYQLTNKFQETVEIPEEWGIQFDIDAFWKKYTEYVKKHKGIPPEQTI